MVTIGGTPCIISSIDNTVITCVTEPHSPPEVTSVKVEVNGNGVSVEVIYDYVVCLLAILCKYESFD